MNIYSYLHVPGKTCKISQWTFFCLFHPPLWYTRMRIVLFRYKTKVSIAYALSLLSKMSTPTVMKLGPVRRSLVQLMQVNNLICCKEFSNYYITHGHCKNNTKLLAHKIEKNIYVSFQGCVIVQKCVKMVTLLFGSILLFAIGWSIRMIWNTWNTFSQWINIE